MLTSYSIFQIRDDKTRELGFLSLQYFRKASNQPTVINMQGVYHKVYEGTIEDSEGALEKLFHKFNVDHPVDYIGRSMSVGDIIQLGQKYYYCDSFDFAEVKVQLAPSARTARKAVIQIGYITTNPVIHVCGYTSDGIQFQPRVGAPMLSRKLKTSEDGRNYFIYKDEKIYLLK